MFQYFFQFIKTLFSFSVLTAFLFFQPLLSSPPPSVFRDTKRISEEKEWIRLLHYQKVGKSSWKSLADGSSFFLSSTGMTSPEDELRIHLKVFFNLPAERKDLECRFPARIRWIRKRFAVSSIDFPIPVCEKLEEFRTQMKARSVSIVFASFHPEHPASLFGHTMLKFNEEKNNEDISEDLVVNYAASIPSWVDPFQYVWKGFTGGFPGTFEIQKYKFKIHEYNEFENRSLWEYKLNFNQDEVQQLTDHLWEMTQNHFDYYFLDENCSFRVLTLLEVARPKLDLTSKYSYLVVPSETLKKVAEEPNLISEIRFRPSIIDRYRVKYALLKSEELEILNQLEKKNWEEFKKLETQRQTLLLDIAIDLLVIRKIKKYGELESEAQEEYNKLASLRGDPMVLNTLAGYNSVSNQSNPLDAHSPSQISTSFGHSNLGTYGEIQLRPVLRDFTDPVKGYSPYNQISFLKTTARKYEEKSDFQIHSLQILEMTSLNPIGQNISKLSWNLDLGLKSLLPESNIKNSRYSNYSYFSGGYGIAWEPSFSNSTIQLIFFSFLNFRTDVSREIQFGYRLGIMPTLAVLMRYKSFYGLQVNGQIRSYGAGETDFFRESSAQLNIFVSESLNWEFKVAELIGKESSWIEYQTGIKYFF